jgi:hypothetical protein
LGFSLRNSTTDFQTLHGRCPVYYHQQNGVQVDFPIHITDFLELEGRCLIGTASVACDYWIVTKKVGIPLLCIRSQILPQLTQEGCNARPLQPPPVTSNFPLVKNAVSAKHTKKLQKNEVFLCVFLSFIL